MGLQSYRWRTLSYVLQTGLKKLPAVPRTQQGPITWSSRHVVHDVIFARSFLFLLWSHTIFRSTVPVPNARFCALCLRTHSPGGSEEQRVWVGPWGGRRKDLGWGASSVADLPPGTEQCHAQLWLPWEEVSLPTAVPAFVSFLPEPATGYEAASGTSFKLIFANIQFTRAKWCRLCVTCPRFFCRLLGCSYWQRKK